MPRSGIPRALLFPRLILTFHSSTPPHIRAPISTTQASLAPNFSTGLRSGTMDAESNSSSMSSSGDDSSTSSDGDDVGERERASADLKQRLSFVGTSIGLAVTIISGMYNMLEVCKGLLGTSRLPNVHRRRDHCADVIGSLSQEQFKSQTGLSRKIFNYLLQLIRPRVQGNRAMGAVSSGSHISSMMKLFIHQRLMKGAKSQDVEWMGTDPKHVWVHIWLPAMPEVPDEFYLALDEAYKSIHDGKHLTPFSGAEMRLAQNSGNEEAARMMRTFNKIFCSD
ncbi:hypothetical protein B484DRAFT_438983, partial [Ochromonadaceae sp. CCMP2298]